MDARLAMSDVCDVGGGLDTLLGDQMVAMVSAAMGDGATAMLVLGVHGADDVALGPATGERDGFIAVAMIIIALAMLAGTLDITRLPAGGDVRRGDGAARLAGVRRGGEGAAEGEDEGKDEGNGGEEDETDVALGKVGRICG